VLSGEPELASHPAAGELIHPARAYRVSPSIAAITALLALLTADILAGASHVEAFALGLVAVVLALWLAHLAKSWTVIIGTIVCVVLLIPNDGAYVLPKALPFQLEPYRVIIALVELGWVVSLLIDSRVRSRTSGFEGPLLLIIAVTLGSDLANPAHVETVASYTIKGLWLFLSFVLLFYLLVSVVRTRVAVERIITVIVSAGTIEGAGGLLQRRSGYNLFDHLHPILPIFNYVAEAQAHIEQRGGYLRAFASSGDPIELSTTMAMLIPLAAYLAISRRQRAWWVAVAIMLFADFAGGSRTGLLGLLAILVIFLWLRSRETLRCWPALIPMVAVLHFAAPGALGGVVEEFFPKGGIVHQQEETEVGPHGEVEYSSRLSRITPELHEYLLHDPLLGQGYGTRVVGFHNAAEDNSIILDDQWLDTLLETGLLGVLAWLWLFGRTIRRLGVRAKLEADSREGWLPVALAASLASCLVAMFFFDAFSYIQATSMAFVLIALSAVLLRIPSHTRPEHADEPKERTPHAPRHHRAEYSPATG
jgi:polysaccharide biosynthesis protein PslJ